MNCVLDKLGFSANDGDDHDDDEEAEGGGAGSETRTSRADVALAMVQNNHPLVEFHVSALCLVMTSKHYTCGQS